MDDGPWVHCPSLDMRPVLLSHSRFTGESVVACPICWWSYVTMMSAPLLPSHWVNRESGDVMVRPTNVVDLR